MSEGHGLEAFDRERLERFTREWEDVFDRCDGATMGAFYAEDGRLIATDLATVEGRPAITRFWQLSSERARLLGLRRAVHLDRVEHAGALGYAGGTVVLERDVAPALTVRYVTVWRREADALWRCIVDISTAAPQE